MLSPFLFDDAKVRAFPSLTNKIKKNWRKNAVLLTYINICVRTHKKTRLFLCAHTVSETYQKHPHQASFQTGWFLHIIIYIRFPFWPRKAGFVKKMSGRNKYFRQKALEFRKIKVFLHLSFMKHIVKSTAEPCLSGRC